MKRVLIRLGAGALALVVLGFGVRYLGGEWYLWTENRNFARLREKSTLDCATMPFHCAVRDGDLASLEVRVARLKAAGLDINGRDRWRATALLYAVANKPEATGVLLQLGVDPNLADENGLAPLSTALLLKRYDLARDLIDAGASPDLLIGSTAKRMTLLTEAVTSRNAEAADFLWRHGADLKRKDEYGYDACQRAEMYETKDLFVFCAEVPK